MYIINIMTRHSVLGTERGLIKHNVQVSRNNLNINLSGPKGGRVGNLK